MFANNALVPLSKARVKVYLMQEHSDAAQKLQQAEKMREAFKAQQQRTHDHERDRER